MLKMNRTLVTILALVLFVSMASETVADTLSDALIKMAQASNVQFILDCEAVGDIDVQADSKGGRDAAVKVAASAGLEVFNYGDILVFYPPARRDHWLAWLGYQAFSFESAPVEKVAELLGKRLEEIGYKADIELNTNEKHFFVTASPTVLSMVEHVAYLIGQKSKSPEIAVAEVFRNGNRLIDVEEKNKDITALAVMLGDKAGENVICDEKVKGTVSCYFTGVHYRLALELLARAATAVVYHMDDGLHIELIRLPSNIRQTFPQSK